MSDAATLLLACERIADAYAEGELADLGFDGTAAAGMIAALWPALGAGACPETLLERGLEEEGRP